MRKERVILSFIALLIGLAVAGGAFYLYQQTQNKPQEVKSETVVSIPTPTPDGDSELLVIEKPKNEDVISSKTLTVSGKTLPESTVVAQTEVDEQVAISSNNGDFQFTIEVEGGLNIISITAVLPDGTEVNEERVITYSEEDF